METFISLSGPWEVRLTLISSNTQNPQFSNWPRGFESCALSFFIGQWSRWKPLCVSGVCFLGADGNLCKSKGVVYALQQWWPSAVPLKEPWCLLGSRWLIITHNSERSHRLWQSIQIASCWRQTIVSFMRHEILNDAEIKRLMIHSWNHDSLICVLRCEQQTC